MGSCASSEASETSVAATRATPRATILPPRVKQSGAGLAGAGAQDASSMAAAAAAAAAEFKEDDDE